MEWGWFGVLDALFCALDFWIFYVWMNRMCPKRKLPRHVVTMAFLGTTLMVLIVSLMGMPALIHRVIGILIFIMGSYIVFKNKIKVSILLTVLYYLMTGVGELLCVGIADLFIEGGSTRIFMIGEPVRYQWGIISKIVCITLIILVSHYINAQKAGLWKYGVLLLGGFYMVAYIFVLSLYEIRLEMVLSGVDISFNGFIGLTVIVVCAFSMTIYIMIEKLEKQQRKEKEYALVQYQMKQLSKSFEETKMLEMEWRKVKHDFSNHLSCIDMLLQMDRTDKARQYMQGLTQSWQEHSYNVQTGHPIADAVIHQKIIRAQSEAIHMDVKGEIGRGIDVSDTDLCALLSNSIDNAIEASCKIGDQGQRQIRVILGASQEELEIEVRNKVHQPINNQVKLVTTKSDKHNHGIGLLSMQTTAQKYGGTVKWTYENEEFRLKIDIPA